MPVAIAMRTCPWVARSLVVLSTLVACLAAFCCLSPFGLLGLSPHSTVSVKPRSLAKVQEWVHLGQGGCWSEAKPAIVDYKLTLEECKSKCDGDCLALEYQTSQQICKVWKTSIKTDKLKNDHDVQCIIPASDVTDNGNGMGRSLTETPEGYEVFKSLKHKDMKAVSENMRPVGHDHLHNHTAKGCFQYCWDVPQCDCAIWTPNWNPRSLQLQPLSSMDNPTSGMEAPSRSLGKGIPESNMECFTGSGCEFSRPRYGEAHGVSSLFVKLWRNETWNYQNYTGYNTYEGRGSKQIAGNRHSSALGPTQTEADCKKRCDAFDECKCAVFMLEDFHEWKKGECWLRKSCHPEKFEHSDKTRAFKVLVKTARKDYAGFTKSFKKALDDVIHVLDPDFNGIKSKLAKCGFTKSREAALLGFLKGLGPAGAAFNKLSEDKFCETLKGTPIFDHNNPVDRCNHMQKFCDCGENKSYIPASLNWDEISKFKCTLKNDVPLVDFSPKPFHKDMPLVGLKGSLEINAVLQQLVVKFPLMDRDFSWLNGYVNADLDAQFNVYQNVTWNWKNKKGGKKGGNKGGKTGGNKGGKKGGKKGGTTRNAKKGWPGLDIEFDCEGSTCTGTASLPEKLLVGVAYAFGFYIDGHVEISISSEFSGRVRYSPKLEGVGISFSERGGQFHLGGPEVHFDIGKLKPSELSVKIRPSLILEVVGVGALLPSLHLMPRFDGGVQFSQEFFQDGEASSPHAKGLLKADLHAGFQSEALDQAEQEVEKMKETADQVFQSIPLLQHVNFSPVMNFVAAPFQQIAAFGEATQDFPIPGSCFCKDWWLGDSPHSKSLRDKFDLSCDAGCASGDLLFDPVPALITIWLALLATIVLGVASVLLYCIYIACHRNASTYKPLEDGCDGCRDLVRAEAEVRPPVTGNSDVAVPDKEYAKKQLLSNFSRKSGEGYLSSLEVALEAKVSNSDIPCVYSLHKVAETFKAPQIDTSVTSLKVQLCFVLDYTGSMKTQIAQAKDSVSKIIEAMKKVKIVSLPNAAIDVEMAAVAYFDWDTETRKRGRPVVSVFGGSEVKEEHSDTLTPDKFRQLGGVWTKDTEALKKWIDQGLGHGGKVPEELTGGLLAAASLKWNADEKLMVVITDAPCHGKDYSKADHDSFCDKTTGLTCTGRPEEPLQSLMAQGVTTVILHTGEAAAVSMCRKLQQTDPMLIHEKVSPSQTAQKVVSVLESKVQVQPLTYILKPFTTVSLPDLATDTSIEVEVSGKKESMMVGSDGLLFLGTATSNPKVTLTRPAMPGLDEWFDANSDKVELDRGFNAEKTYLLKVPLKSQVLHPGT